MGTRSLLEHSRLGDEFHAALEQLIREESGDDLDRGMLNVDSPEKHYHANLGENHELVWQPLLRQPERFGDEQGIAETSGRVIYVYRNGIAVLEELNSLN